MNTEAFLSSAYLQHNLIKVYLISYQIWNCKAVFQNCLQLFIEMLHNLSPPHLSCCFPLIPASGPPLHSIFLFPPLSFPFPFHSLHWVSPLSFSTPTLHCPPPLPGGWWPGTGTVQGILSDTIMRELCGTCCSSSNHGSPRSCTTSR